ncbi:MAG: FAD-dependent oxidoreductase [Chloroflexi bacterium]|nr:FAD-dependent oxidoreductase [Chloroflexota bacterium]
MIPEDPERTAGRKERLKIPHTPYPERESRERVVDFGEIVIGYDAESARREASRCIQCPQPSACVAACPLHNDIPAALWLIAQGDFNGAANVYRQTSIFPEFCGRVCPQERLCEGACAMGKHYETPSLGKLEMFVADYQRQMFGGYPALEKKSSTGKSVAIVGSGPAGLAVAERLIQRGHAVTVYEAMPFGGGLLMYGIPNFKLAKSLIVEKIEFLQKIGVKFNFNTRIGKDVTVDELFNKGFGAVFIGVGANVDAPLKAEGVKCANRPTWASALPSSAAATRRRIVCGLRFVWARRKSFVIIAAPKPRCPARAKNGRTPWKRARTLNILLRRQNFLATPTGACVRWNCSAWNWANPIRRDAADRCR